MGRNAGGERGKKFKHVNKDGKDENNRKHETGMELENMQFETSHAAICSALNTTVFHNMTHGSMVCGYHRFGGI
jgi:hypothetical protein